MSVDNKNVDVREGKGRVFVCGCSPIYLNHKSGEPSQFDRAIDRIKNMF